MSLHDVLTRCPYGCGGIHQSDKRALPARLTEAFRDERWQRVGTLALVGGSAEDVVCDLVFDSAWQGTLAAHPFATTG